jgi:hypothetical protein
MERMLSQATEDPLAPWDPGATRRELDDLLKRQAASAGSEDSGSNDPAGRARAPRFAAGTAESLC